MTAPALRGQTCTIRTRGRRTGDEHVVRVWFVVVDGWFYAAARHGLASDWLQNALHDGTLEIAAARTRWTGRASLTPAEDVPAVLEAFGDKYSRHPAIIDAWRAHPPVFVRAAAEAGGADASRATT